MRIGGSKNEGGEEVLYGGSVYYTKFVGQKTELIIRDDSLDFGIAPYDSVKKYSMEGKKWSEY